MRDFLHHTAKTSSIGPLDHLIDLPQTQSSHDLFMFLRRANGAAHEFDSDLAFHHIFSTAIPRISATAFLSRNCSSALIVALTTLWGLCDPIDLVSTLGIPAACTTARTGPPAITPVPSGAGLSSTMPLPNRPSTWCGMVVSSR